MNDSDTIRGFLGSREPSHIQPIEREQNISPHEDMILSSQPLPPHLRRIHEVFYFDYSCSERISMQLESNTQIIEMIQVAIDFIAQNEFSDQKELLIAMESEADIISYSRVSAISVVQF